MARSVLSFMLLLGSVLGQGETNQLTQLLTSRSYGGADLFQRQSQAFQPGTSFGSGSDCAAAFGTGYISCEGTIHCYNPSAGESCCDKSDPYACPAQSFCLVQGYCCPDGLDAASCALQNSVTLPAGFSTDAIAVPTASSTPVPSSESSVGTEVPTDTVTVVSGTETQTELPTSVPSYSALASTGFPSPSSNITIATSSATPTTTSPPYITYTGAANRDAIATMMAALGALGAAVAAL